MHPILDNRDRLSLYLAAWIPIAVLLMAILAKGTALSWADSAVLAIPMCFLYAFMCLAAWYVCRSAPLRNPAVLSLIGTLTAASLFATTLWIVLGQAWATALEFVPPFTGIGALYTDRIAILFVTGVLLFLLAVAVHYLLLMLEESRNAEKRALEVQVLAREAELKALRAQIDPHFLFNSLNSINALAVADPPAARRMCVLLADFFRNSLRFGGREQITLAEELQLADAFLGVEKVRFGNRLSVEMQVENECRDCRVPPLLIQPLIENAITHGIAPMIEGGTLTLAVRRSDGRLEIVVENPRDPEAVQTSGAGVGIHNVRQRLSNMFPDDSRIEVTKEDTRFRIRLLLPCIRSGVNT